MASRKTRPAYEPLAEGGGRVQRAVAAPSIGVPADLVPADLLATLNPSTAADGALITPEATATPHYHGHRDRLRERFRSAGADALPDYELLELMLFRTMRQGDTKPLAKRLIEKFGSFAEVLNAPPTRLAEVKGVGEVTITDLMLIAASAARIARGAVKKQLTLGSWSAVIEYCRTAMAFADKEHFRILFLDKRNQLIADEVQQSGTIDHTPVYPREVVKRALELSATALILVHNHPSGDPTPSNADIQMTKQIAEIAGHLGIAVHDHIIVGRGGHASLKGLKLI